MYLLEYYIDDLKLKNENLYKRCTQLETEIYYLNKKNKLFEKQIIIISIFTLFLVIGIVLL